MSVNFDAKLTLDIAMFMRNVKTAENAFDNLASKISNTRIQMPGGQAANLPAIPGIDPAEASRQSQRVDQSVRNAARERYALYDVAAAYQEMSNIAVASLTAVIGTATQYERAFADVVRTTDFVSAKTGEAARVMRFELMQLAGEIPVAFGQITEIATIGNQLGIAQADLTNFTETVAKFATTTDATVNNAALSFGRIGELLNVSDFNALGSAIAFAGVNAVATETQILAVTKEIATTAKQAKFAAPDVIGLATALSSLGIAPEAARGSIIRSFAAINAAITKGGQDLQNYANISGMSAEQFASTWQRSGSEAFDALLRGLQASSDQGNNLDSVLRGLGIRNVRDIQTLQKLGDNYGVYAQSIRDANQAYEEGTFLSEAYGIVQETVASKLQVIQNQIDNFFASLGESTSGPIKVLLDVISTLLDELTKLARNPAIQMVVIFATGVAALVAAIAALNAVVALAQASMLAFSTAMTASAAGATAAAAGVSTFTWAAKGALLVFGKFALALAAFGVAISAVSLAGDAVQRAIAPMDFTRRKAEELVGGFSGLQEALSQDYAASLKELGSEAAIAAAITNGSLTGMTNVAIEATEEFQDLKDVQEGYAQLLDTGVKPGVEGVTDSLIAQNVVLGENFKKWVATAIQQEGSFDSLAKNKELIGIFDKIGFSLDDATKAAANGEGVINYIMRIADASKELTGLERFNLGAQLAAAFAGGGDLGNFANALEGIISESRLLAPLLGKANEEIEGAGKGAGEIEDGFQGAAKALRTVVDYASDLRSILARVTDLQFSKILGRDEIAEGFDRIRDSSADAAEAIREANLEINDLTADRGTLQYQLSVAERYGDEKRAAKLRADIAKIDARILDQENKRTEATNASSTALTGTTEAARENRAALIGVISSYQDYIATLAALGRKPAQLAGDIANLKNEFRKQALELGFSEEELSSYLELFDNFGQVASNAPRDVDIELKLGISAAEQAITEFLGKNREMGVGVKPDTVKAETDVNNFLNKPRVITAPQMQKIETLAADGSLKSWLNLRREFGAPVVTGITPDAADRKIRDWLNQQRILSNPRINDVNTSPAQTKIDNFIRDVGRLKAVITMDLDRKSTLNAMANTTWSISSLFGGVSPLKTFWQGISAAIRAIPGFADGGLISGPGGARTDSILARVSSGEYVMNAGAVRGYGLDFMNAINQQKFAGSMPASVSSGNSAGTTVAFLSPEDRALLRAVADRPVELYADSRKIAQTANDGNALIARRGVR